MTAVQVATDARATNPRTFWVACTYDDDGTIRDGNGKVLLSFHPSDRQVTFSDPTSREVFVVRRRGIAPFSQWLLFAADVLVWTIRRRGPWRSRYTLTFAKGRRWTVRFPLFKVCYTCTSDEGEHFRLALVQHTAWCVERLPEHLDLSFLAGLAVIQRERWWA
jgi:hypothetical protein